ncbi:MAG TPA: hypothetical protein VN031_02105 [Candidatus Microsaccharimonas sp.]|nr:hypothetical protein [Candidatus Microsaccharimonas sp.]
METETQEAAYTKKQVIQLISLMVAVMLFVLFVAPYALRPLSLYMTKHGLCSHPYESMCNRPAPHPGQHH